MKILVCFLTLSFLFTALPASADDAAGLLGKHQAYVGWRPGDGTFATMAFEGDEIRTKGGSETVTEHLREWRKQLAYRDTATSVKYGTTSDSGFTGRVFWETNRNGFTHPVIGDAEKYQISYDLIFNEGFASLANPQMRGTKSVSGTQCSVVEVAIDASFPIDACIDPSNGALVQAVIDPRSAYETTITVLSYATVAGSKRVISGWRYGDSSDYAYRWTKITPNAPVGDDQLHPPAQTATWAFGSSQPIPIDFEHTDMARGIYVHATVNGVPGRFLVDTGAGEIALNRSFTTRLHLKALFNSKASGVTGLTNTEVQRADTIQIGDNVLSNVVLSTLDHDLFDGKENEKEVDGIIGFDLFGGALVNIDLDAQQMTIYNPAQMQPDDKTGVQLSVDLESLQPMIPMTVNKGIPIRAILDTGDLLSRGIVFSREMGQKYGLNMLAQRAQYTSGVGAGVSFMRCGVLDALSVGPIVYQSAPACETSGAEDNWALVGFDFLQHFNMLFDYPQGKLILIPRKDS